MVHVDEWVNQTDHRDNSDVVIVQNGHSDALERLSLKQSYSADPHMVFKGTAMRRQG